MIVQWIVQVGLGIATWFGTLMPTWAAPSWFTGLGGTVNGLFGMVSGFGPFGDWGLIGGLIGVPLSLWVGGLLFKVGRLFVSHIPFFGGK
jgi:hypothetical protein